VKRSKLLKIPARNKVVQRRPLPTSRPTHSGRGQAPGSRVMSSATHPSSRAPPQNSKTKEQNKAYPNHRFPAPTEATVSKSRFHRVPKQRYYEEICHRETCVRLQTLRRFRPILGPWSAREIPSILVGIERAVSGRSSGRIWPAGRSRPMTTAPTSRCLHTRLRPIPSRFDKPPRICAGLCEQISVKPPRRHQPSLFIRFSASDNCSSEIRSRARQYPHGQHACLLLSNALNCAA